MSKPVFSLTEEYSIDCITGVFNDYFIAQDWANDIFEKRCKYSEVVAIYLNGELLYIKDEEKI